MVLEDAKQAGYAEADPTFDIAGIDSAHKLAIMVSLAYGTPVNFKEIYTEGIAGLTPVDIAYAKEFGFTIKLLAIAKYSDGEIEARVHPTMVPSASQIAKVDGVYNAIQLVGDAVEDVVLYGRGAGSMPTGSAVVSDVMSIARNLLKNASGTRPACVISTRSTAALTDAADGRNHLALLYSFHGPGPPGRVVADCRSTGPLRNQYFFGAAARTQGRADGAGGHHDAYGERARYAERPSGHQSHALHFRAHNPHPG